MERLFPATTTDKIVGSKESDRSTKTFISSERSAIVVSLLLGHARSCIRRTMMLHNTRAISLGQLPMTWDQIVEYYPGCKHWAETHQFLVEHFGSQEGFLVQAAVKLESSKLEQEKQRADSSVQQGQEKK